MLADGDTLPLSLVADLGEHDLAKVGVANETGGGSALHAEARTEILYLSLFCLV